MNTTQSAGRQFALTAIQDFAASDITGGGLQSNTQAATLVAIGVKLPNNCILKACGILVETAFSGSGVTAATAVLGVTGTLNKFTSSALDLTATGYHAGSAAYVPEYDGADMIMTPTVTGGTLSAGAGKIIAEYVITHRVNEIQTN